MFMESSSLLESLGFLLLVSLSLSKRWTTGGMSLVLHPRDYEHHRATLSFPNRGIRVEILGIAVAL